MSSSKFDIPVQVGPLTFRNPFVVASGPTTKTIDQLLDAERNGWAAASTKLTIDPAYISREPRYRWFGKQKLHTFTAEKRLTLDQGLSLIDQGRSRTRDILLLANITYAGPDGLAGWQAMARQFEAAGAHAIEVNLCCPNMSYNLDVAGKDTADRPASGASVGQDPDAVADIVSAVVEAVGVPVIAKITPEGGRIGPVARRAFEAGAACVVGTGNRLGVPEFDIRKPFESPYALQAEHSMSCLSGSWLKPLGLRDVHEMRLACGPDHSLMGCGGVVTYTDAVQYAMLGASLVGICTETMVRGFDFLPEVLQHLCDYMAEMGSADWAAMTGLLTDRFATADTLTLSPGHAKIDTATCTACGLCVRIGHCDAIEQAPGDKPAVRVAKCLACGTCIDICPAGAIEMIQQPADGKE